MEDTALLTADREKAFLLSELYLTVQGESSFVGLPTVFVRLYSCNLRCRWCDSMHAVEGGEFTRVAVDDVVRRVGETAAAPERSQDGVRHVCWTGGEPLLQGEAIAHAVELLPETFVHSIETDGEIDLRPFDRLTARARDTGRVRYIMDVKCPGSGMAAKEALENLPRLREQDEVKFVLLDRADYDFAKGVLRDHPTKAGTILFSPANPAHRVTKGLDPCQLADWILKDRLRVRLQIQLHKVLWPGKERGI
jgi:7-carboxy-7-deazaguanine synthase